MNHHPDMRYRIAFKNLPFVPEKNQVVYVENIFDEKVNSFIREKYDELELWFKALGLEFVYLPLHFNMPDVEKQVRYYAPYLVSLINTPETLHSSYLLDFMVRPENKRRKAVATMQNSLNKGDRVVTIGGIHGRIHSIEENTVTLINDEGGKWTFERNAIARKAE